MRTSPRLMRITTAPISLHYLLRGQLTFFQQQGFHVLAVSAEGDEVTDIARESKHQVIPMTRSITPFQDLYCLWLLVRLIIRFKPNIVHTHTPKAGLLGMMAAWMCRVPVRMHTVAGLPLMEEEGLKRWLLTITERITYACASRVYPNSKGLLLYIEAGFKNADAGKEMLDTGYSIPGAGKEKRRSGYSMLDTGKRLLDAGKRLLHAGSVMPDDKGVNDFRFKLPDSKFKIIGKGSTNGIDVHFFKRSEALEQEAKEIRQRYNIRDEVVFCFVGRLVKDKGLVELVTAFEKLTTPSRLLLVGGFEERLDPLPEKIMTFLKHDPRVILVGFQKDVRPWMMASDVFVFPSYREGFPNVVMQAACLELPCIVSDINGCNELVVHGETGWIVPTKNADKLLEAMRDSMSNLARARGMAEAARSFVAANFDRDYVLEQLLREYRLLMRSDDLTN